MMLPVQVSAVGQRLELDQQKFVHTLDLLFGDGYKITVVVSEQETEHIMSLCVAQQDISPGEQDYTSMARESAEPSEAYSVGQDTVQVFGGVTDEPEILEPPKPVKRRVTLLGKDDAGNPIVRANFSMEPTYQENVDDEGVPSL